MYPAFESLKGKRVVLASTSPRRIELFNRMGLEYVVVPSHFEENLPKSSFASAAAYSAATCRGKAFAVLEKEQDAASLIVSADTIVVCGSNIFEKASDRADAKRMLKELSGQIIQVITAVTMLYRVDGRFEEVSFEETSDMFMEDLDDAMIDAYLDLNQGRDHSGALSYQEGAFLLVRGIRGCFYNLIGFPAARFYQELVKVKDLIQ